MYNIITKLKIIVFYLIYGVIYLGVHNFRNDLYSPLYSSLYSKNIEILKRSIFQLIIVAILIFLLDFICEFFKEYMVFKNRKNITQFLKSYSNLSQHVSVDQKTIVENYCMIFFKFFPSIFLIGWFTPKMFKIIGKDYFLIAGLLIYTIITIFSIVLFKYVYGIFYKKNIFFEEKIRVYFHSWFDIKKIIPIEFDKESYETNIKGVLQVGIFNGLNKAAITLYQSISLILPFVIFLSYYLSGSYDIGIYMQLINIWTTINYSIQGLFESWESYSGFKVNKKRIKWALEHSKNKIKQGDSIKLKNIKLSFGQKKILDIEEVSFEMGKIINIYGKHGSGKTSLAKIIVGILKPKGYIETLKDFIYIPEDARMPKDMKFEETEEFVRYCKIFEVNPSIVCETACGSEKWRLIMSYALSLNNYVIIDDPFWGNSGMEQKEKLVEELGKRKGGLIFSAKPINGLCEKICFEQINLAY